MAQTTEWGLGPALRAIDERRWLRHGLFWLADAAFMAWLFRFELHTTTVWWRALRDALLHLVPHMLIAYALLEGVLPQLWRDGGPGRLVLALAGWLVLSLALTTAYRFLVFIPSHRGEASPFPDYYIVFATGAHMPPLLIAGVAACLRVYRRWRQKGLDNARLAQENYQAELQLLKAQIHPHFLFNTLNTLYALTLRQSDQAPVAVARLTGLLRFVVEQGDAPLVALADEVALLRNFLALEQLRYGARLRVEFQAAVPADAGRIAPLLLLPLVENACKHGAAEQLGQARIGIVLAVADGEFTCVITNSMSPGPATGPAGIGLRNVRQRLQLLYPQRHRFAAEAAAGTFTVRLALRLPAPAAPARRRTPAAQHP